MANATATPMTTTQKIIAIAVAIIIISTVALPVISDLQKSIDTEANNTGLIYSYVVNDEIPDITLSVSGTTYSINGEAAYTGLNTFDLVVVCDNAVFRYLNTGGGYMSGSFDVSPYKNTNATWSLTVSEGSATVTFGTTDYDLGELTYLYYPNPKGDHGIVSSANAPTSDIHLDRDKEALLVAFGNRTGLEATDPDKPAALATYKNGEITSIFAKSVAVGSTSRDNATVVWAVDVIDNDDVNNQQVGAASLSYTVGASSGTNPETFLIVPIGYHYTSDADSSLINLIGVIPIMLILIPLMMAVRMIALKRN